ncbi:MAG: hypothetical protein ABI867_30025 [Kofleriaceae bacterium]
MSGFPIALLAAWQAACSGGAASPVTPVQTRQAPTLGRSTPSPHDQVPIDPIAVLAPSDDALESWLVPGRIQLDLGVSSVLEGPGGNRPIAVTLVDQQGTLVRAVVRLEHARFSLWTDRARLLAVLAREQRVTTFVGAPPIGDTSVVLKAGARVRRLAHKGTQTQVRFVGAVEVTGWVPDAALADAGPPRDRMGRMPSGRRTLVVLPGAIVRVEPAWSGGELATMAGSSFLDTIQDIDATWVEVAYVDGEVDLHGYVSKQAPPGRVHRTKDPDVPVPTVTANGKVASGTCLYAKQRGEAIGYVVGDRDVHLDDAGNGWWTLALDTPWGPIPFAARGPTQQSLTACAPAGTVPPPVASPSVP